MIKTKINLKLSSLLICLIIISIIWIFIGNNIYKPKDYETLDIFISAENANTAFFKEQGKNIKDIKKTSVTIHSPEKKYYDELFQTNGLYSDILIIESKYLEADANKKEFAPLDDELFTKYQIDKNNYSLLTDDSNTTYGIIIYDKVNNINLFGDKIAFATDDIYCLCIGINKPNAYPYSSGKYTTHNAFLYAYQLLKK